MSGDAAARAARLEELLDLALDTDPVRRDEVLASACHDDNALLAEARALVAALAQSGEFLEQPAAAVLGLTPADAPLDPARALVGQSIGAWRLVRELGAGGMGTVFLGEREIGGFQQEAAIKVVHSGSPGRAVEIAQRFLAERQILARLSHPNLARLVDGGSTPSGTPWFAMEYVDGRRLTDWCDDMGTSLEARISLFEQVADAVRHAHRNLVVHRDIKPSNILVTSDGVAKLLDFGIAKVLGDMDGAARDMTSTNVWIMTPEYAAPEQVRGESITTATDVYALGLVLYELLSGCRAHDLTRRSAAEIERVICEVEPPRMSMAAVTGPTSAERAAKRGVDVMRLQRLLAGDLDTIVAKAMHKDPQRRYPTVDALLDDLHRHRDGLPVQARPEAPGYRLLKFVRRHRVGVAATAVIALAILAGVATTLWQARIAQAEATKAKRTAEFVVSLFQGANPDISGGREATARDLVDRGVERIDSALAAQPGVRQELLGVLGETYRDLGQLNAADSVLQRAVALARDVFGPGSAEYAGRLSTRGTVLNALGNFPAADSLLTHAAEILRQEKGSRSEEYATALGEVANNLEDMGEFDRAVEMHHTVIAIDRAVYGSESLPVATDLDNLGVTLGTATRYEGADSAHRASLAIRQKLLPPGHTAILNVLGNLGVTQSRLGNAEAAESLARIVLAGRRRILPPGHRDLAYALDALSTALDHQGRLEEAVPPEREALDIRRRALGANHSVTMISANNLAVLFVRLGWFDSAATIFDDAVRRWTVDYGANDARTATGINNRGVALMGAGKWASAEADIRRALSIRRAVLGDTVPDVGVSRKNLATLLVRTGRAAEAEQEILRALEIFKQALPDGHPRYAEAWVALGEVLLARGRPREADSVLTRARIIQKERLPGQDYRVAESAWLQGRARLALGKVREADSLLAESEQTYARFPGFRTRVAEISKLRAQMK